MNGLTMAEMAQISEPWVTPGPKRDAVLAVPALAGMLPSIEGAHLGLKPVVPEVTLSARLEELTDEGSSLDWSHDNGMRGVHGFLSGMILLARTEPTRTTLRDVRNQLLPEGLEGTQKTYRGESGEALLLETRLRENPELAAKIESITVPVDGGVSLGTYVRAWVADAKRLGEVDSERTALVEAAALPGAAPAVTRADARTARAIWRRQVRAMLAIAEATKLSDASFRTIFGDLEAAESIAAKRGRPGKAAKANAAEAEAD